jgi:hypothetical protein
MVPCMHIMIPVVRSRFIMKVYKNSSHATLGLVHMAFGLHPSARLCMTTTPTPRKTQPLSTTHEPEPLDNDDTEVRDGA